MRKTGKFILILSIIIEINTFFSYAKINDDHVKFFNDIVGQEKYFSALASTDVENLILSLPDIEEEDIDDKLSVSIPVHSETNNAYESIAVWIFVICFVLCIVKFLFKNFNMPFDYDPNIKSKHLTYKRVRNKKFKKR